MKKNFLISAAALITISSCNNAAENKPATTDTTATAAIEKPKPVYSYPIRYKDWEIGDPANINTVLAVYKAWDDKKIDKIAEVFADTVRMRIPEEKAEIVLPKDKINEALTKNMSLYKLTSNNVISAVSLHDKESAEDWVMITLYSKWIEKNGTRDSMIYHDDWKLKNGKLDFLMSYDKTPTKEFLMRNDPK